MTLTDNKRTFGLDRLYGRFCFFIEVNPSSNSRLAASGRPGIRFARSKEGERCERIRLHTNTDKNAWPLVTGLPIILWLVHRTLRLSPRLRAKCVGYHNMSRRASCLLISGGCEKLKGWSAKYTPITGQPEPANLPLTYPRGLNSMP